MSQKNKKLVLFIKKLVENEVKRGLKEKQEVINKSVRKIMLSEMKKYKKVLRKQVLQEVHQLVQNSNPTHESQPQRSEDEVLNNVLKQQDMYDNSRKIASNPEQLAEQDDTRSIQGIKERIRQAQKMGLNESTDHNQWKNMGNFNTSNMNQIAQQSNQFDPSNFGPGKMHGAQHGGQGGGTHSDIPSNRVQGVDPENEISPRAKQVMQNDSQFFNKITKNAKAISDEATKKESKGVNWTPGQ